MKHRAHGDVRLTQSLLHVCFVRFQGAQRFGEGAMAELMDNEPQPLAYWDRKQFSRYSDQVRPRMSG